MKPSTAAAVTTMMEAVVNEGTGTSAQIAGRARRGQDGHGGDADRHGDQQRVVHRVRAGVDAPKVAIAVTLKGVPGQGGAFAAPIAREVMERLLHD